MFLTQWIQLNRKFFWLWGGIQSNQFDKMKTCKSGKKDSFETDSDSGEKGLKIDDDDKVLKDSIETFKERNRTQRM